MKREVNPMIVWAALGVVVVVLIAVGYRLFSGRYAAEKTDISANLTQYNQTGTVYQPPAQIPGVSGGGGPGGAPMVGPGGPGGAPMVSPGGPGGAPMGGQ